MRGAARQILILSIVVYFVMVGVSIVSPVLPLYALSFGISLALVGALISGFGLARLLLDIPVGLICDRVGTRRFMLWGLIIVAGASVLAGLATDYWMLLLGRVREGVGSAIYTTTSLTTVGRYAPKEKRGRYLSFYLSMLLLGTVSGPALGGFVGEQFGLNAPFFLYAIFAFISFLLIWGGIDPAGPSCPTENQPSMRQIGVLAKNYTLTSINLVTFAIFVGRMGVVSTLVPLFAIETLGMSATSLGVILALSALANFISMLPAGSLTDKYGRKMFMFSSLFVSGVMIALLPFCQNIETFSILMIALGFVMGLSGPIAAWITDITKPHELGTAMGLFRTAGDAGFVIGPAILAILSGPATDVGVLPFLVGGAMMSSFSFLLLKAEDPVRKNRILLMKGS